METIAQDNLKEIFHFLGVSYFLLLKQVNKKWKQIIENEMKIENTNQRDFYSFVNDFISRKDFEELNIQFVFQNHDLFLKFSSFGFLNSVKYLHEKNPKTKKIKRRDNQEINWDKWSCENASYYGHLDILKYLHENNCPWDDWCCENASYYGHLDILKYLHENKCPIYKKDCLDVAKNNEIKEYIENFM